MNQHLNRASNLFLLLLAVCSQIAIIQETLDCRTDPSLIFWITALSLFTWYAASFRRGILVGMPLSALTLYLAYRRFGADPTTELTDLFDKITGVYYENIFAPGSVYDYLNATSEQTLVLMFLAFLLAAYLSSALTSRSGRMVMSFMGTIPFFVSCLSVNGTPSAVPVVGMVLFWILLLVSGGSYNPNSNDGRAVFLTLFPLLVLLLIILWFNRPELYHPENQDQSLNLRFDEWNRRFSYWVGGQGEPPASASQAPKPEDEISPKETEQPVSEMSPWRSEEGILDLTREYDPESLDTLLFRVKAERDGALYLRTVSYGDYTGTAWKAENIGSYSSLPYAALAIGTQGREQTLQIKDAAGFVYRALPYYSEESGTDSYVPAPAAPAYQAEYRHYSGDFTGLSVPEALRGEEEKYAETAAAYYTGLPESARTAMRAICEREGISAQSPDVISAVADYVRNTGTYDLSPIQYPGDDYALYFLEEAQRGYCIHFATAAAVMYRALGIPARVTEGFLVSAESGRYIDVRIENAHAWVEVYMNGIGWIPVEVTGQSGLAQGQAEELPSPAETHMPQDVQETEPEGSAPTPQPLPVGIATEESAPSLPEDSSSSKALRTVLFSVLLVSLCLGAVPLWRILKRRTLASKLGQVDRRRAAIAVWRYASKAAAYGLVEVPSDIKTLAEKASFSLHGISEDELRSAQLQLDDMLRQTYCQLKPIPKIWFKYFQGLV